MRRDMEKLSSCKAQIGVEVLLHAFLNSALHEVYSTASYTSRFIPINSCFGHKIISTRKITTSYSRHPYASRLCMKCDDTRAEARFRLSAKWTSPFKSAVASVQSATGSRGVRISGSNAGYTMFRGSVKVLATHSIRQFPLHFPPVRHRVPSHFNWPLPMRVRSHTHINTHTRTHKTHTHFLSVCHTLLSNPTVRRKRT